LIWYIVSPTQAINLSYLAKLNSLFRYDGTFGGVTVVRSRAYGDHIRKARTKFTLSEEMKRSTEKLKLANVYAKAFKDAIDPYRRDFRDGQLWQRLVSLFKTQLSKEGKVDFKILDGQELNKIHPLGRIIFTEAEVSQLEGILKVSATSVVNQDPTHGRANGYQQTLIIFFVGTDLDIQSFSQSAYISLAARRGEQTASWTIPDKAAVAIVVTMCNFSLNNEPMNLQKGMGMRVMKVVRI
jgi:hypothetical protein